MADTKKGRDKKAHDAERRQRERELEEALERGDDPEPEQEIEELDEMLDSYTYPIRGVDLIEEEGDVLLRSPAGRATVETLLEPVEDESFDSPDEVRTHLIEQLSQD